MEATDRPKGRQSPASTSSAPLTRNAPTATGKPPCGTAEAASSAAPGVDQATLIGIRRHRLSTIPQSPMAMERAMRPEAASAGPAPMARRPCRTTAKEEAKPTKPDSSPAARAGREGMRTSPGQRWHRR